MFTGLIQELGKVSSIQKKGDYYAKIDIQCSEAFLEDISIGDSIAINGACQTVASYRSSSFSIESLSETIKKTNFMYLKNNSLVNLEKSLKLDSKLDGHMVQGHITSMAKVVKVTKSKEKIYIKLIISKKDSVYMLCEGSVTIDGISLTIASINHDFIEVNIIPTTWDTTNLKYMKVGYIANIESDINVRALLKNKEKKEKEGISLSKLKQWGY